MKQEEFDILLSLLRRVIQEENIYAECYNALKQDRILLHQLGLFETQNVVSIFKDKIALQELNIQQHGFIGMQVFFQKLTAYKNPYLQQFIVAASNGGYLLILSPDISELVGVLKNPKLNFENDLEQQRQLQQLGHSNRDLFLFENGLAIDVVK